MLDRLAGLETEYALHWLGRGRSSPSKQQIYAKLDHAVRGLVATQPGTFGTRDQRFTENGGSYAFETLPQFHHSGFFEMATPECRGPSDLLLYKKAQDHLLAQAIPEAVWSFSLERTYGRLAVLENARDAQGNRYGPQENYEVTMAASAGHHLLLVAGLVTLLPFLLISVLALWVLVAVFVVAAVLVLLGLILYLLLLMVRRGGESLELDDRLDSMGESFTVWLARCYVPCEQLVLAPSVLPFLGLLRLLAFRRERRLASSFLVSRMVFSGAGSLGEDGVFRLSEKGWGLRSIMRRNHAPSSASIFDTGNLTKPLGSLLTLDLRGWWSLTAPRQRMQLGLSDSNLCEWALFTKLGTTMLVLDMVENGALDDAPRLAKPLEAMRTWNREDGYLTPVPTHEHGLLNSVDIQRFYLTRARSWVAAQPAVSLEARSILSAWALALDMVEPKETASRAHPAFGRIDWVTKRALILEAGAGETFAVQKKIDLKYHEVATGYHAQLVHAGACPHLVDPARLDELIRTPPSQSPAELRGQLIRRFSQTHTKVRVSWRSVRVGGRLGGRLGGKVIDLSQRREATGDVPSGDE